MGPASICCPSRSEAPDKHRRRNRKNETSQARLIPYGDEVQVYLRHLLAAILCLVLMGCEKQPVEAAPETQPGLQAAPNSRAQSNPENADESARRARLPDVASNATARPQPSPESFVGRFYSGFNEKEFRTVAAFTPFFSRDLQALLLNAVEAEKAYLDRYPTDKGPLGEGPCIYYGGGDCSFEAFEVLGSTPAGQVIKVTVQLKLLPRRTGEEAYVWTNVLTLDVENGRWVVIDIERDDRRLSDDLKRIVLETQRALK